MSEVDLLKYTWLIEKKNVYFIKEPFNLIFTHFDVKKLHKNNQFSKGKRTTY